jgi:rhodanese-related sulfurtransferase
MTRFALLAFVVALPISAHAAGLTNDTLETVKAKIEADEAILVDVREQQEWDQGHIEGAIFLPLGKLQNGIDAKTLAKQLPKHKIIYTHCVVGKRSVTAGNILERFGYQVRPLKPGYVEMLQVGFKKAAKAKPR